MTEKEKVLQVIEKYKEFFDGEDGIDVAISAKGEFFFYSYAKEFTYFDYFIKFHMAEELERIIIGNMVNDVNCIVDPLIDELEMQTRQIDSLDTEAYDFRDEVMKLSEHLASVERVLTKNNEVFRILFRGLKNVCDRVKE